MKKYEISYMHQSIKQKLTIEASSEHEAAQKFKTLAPDVPADNVLTVIDLSATGNKLLIAGVIATLVGWGLYANKYFFAINFNMSIGVFTFLSALLVIIGIIITVIEIVRKIKIKKKLSN